MRDILVVMPVQDHHKELLERQAPDGVFHYCEKSQVTKEMIQNANIIVGNVAPADLAGAENLELVQLNSAGTDGYLDKGVLQEETVLANATGAYGLAISEHMLAAVLALKKRLNQYMANQKEHIWNDEGPVSGIYGSTALIVGLGDIGGEFAKRIKALGGKTIGVVRTQREKPDYADELYTLEDLPELLPRADIVASCLPGMNATYQLFNREKFRLMKESAVFLNVGRGTAVDTEALAEALNSGIIAGASVDVTDPEPLPADSPLWDARNILITPHVAGGYHMQETWDRIICIAAANIRALYEGTAFTSVVDRTTGYRKRS